MGKLDGILFNLHPDDRRYVKGRFKEKDARIQELEEENKNLQLGFCKECQNERESLAESLLKDFEKENKEIKKENAKLQEQLKNAIVIPKNFDVGQIVYMIPTEHNSLKTITAYTILSFTKSDIGCRAALSILEKQKDVSPYFYASFDMFNTIIFPTEVKAHEHLEGLI